ncbi:hypothetical protein NPIL_624921 [Nephila pilipes]|uniref:Uncharacterized protein n=1 Tax=Nephila pilipes TaxID=299642 RepID=A0A8X6TEX9_NEPPI|nr:hypothetical protein NPIL_624921 [Nephila pilipes]
MVFQFLSVVCGIETDRGRLVESKRFHSLPEMTKYRMTPSPTSLMTRMKPVGETCLLRFHSALDQGGRSLPAFRYVPTGRQVQGSPD